MPVSLPTQQGDVVLISVPFLETAGEKIRPALILSNSNAISKSQTVFLIPITTNTSQSSVTSSFTYLFSPQEQKLAKLNHISLLRIDRVTALDKMLIIKKLGRVSSATLSNIKKIFLSQI